MTNPSCPSCSGRKSCAGGKFAKKWKPEFLTERKFNDQSVVEYKRKELNVKGDGIRLFLESPRNSLPSSVIQQIRRFCRGKRLDDLKSGPSVEGSAGVAW